MALLLCCANLFVRDVKYVTQVVRARKRLPQRGGPRSQAKGDRGQARQHRRVASHHNPDVLLVDEVLSVGEMSKLPESAAAPAGLPRPRPGDGRGVLDLLKFTDDVMRVHVASALDSFHRAFASAVSPRIERRAVLGEAQYPRA